MEREVRLRWVRAVYYSGVAVVAAVAHASGLDGVIGSGAASFLSRNSEAYVLMLLVPLYWDAISGRGSGRRGAWYAFLAIGTVALQAGAIGAGWASDIPTSVVTLGEGFAGVLAMSVYFDLTRSPRFESGLAPATWRAAYYLVAMVVMVLVHQDAVLSSLVSSVADVIAINTEAYAAVILIPFYFDVISPTLARGRPLEDASPRPGWVRALWYAGLVLVPLAAAPDAEHWLTPLAHWLSLTTEAFIAAIVISLYFDAVRWVDRDQLRVSGASQDHGSTDLR
ncbi:MAG: hypothetical protein ACR2NL_03685 [Acidimicrobiia bacterium]